MHTTTSPKQTIRFHDRPLRRWLGAAAIMLAGLLAGGCVRTTQPILKDEQVILDNSLVGTWVTEKGDQTAEIQPAGPDKRYPVLYTDEKGKQGVFVARLGKVGELLVAEFKAADPAPQASEMYKSHLLPVYSFLILRQTTPRLVLTTMSVDWLKKYASAHPDELAVAKIDDAPLVTASTADFQAFLLRHAKDQGAMGDQQVMVHPGDPTTQPAGAGL